MTRQQIAFKAAFFRFVRIIVPQIPALIAIVKEVKPEYMAFWVFLGAVVTALDKFCREIGWYGKV